jgi:hypothetical protein
LFYVHCESKQNARMELPAAYPERAAYVAAGSVEVCGQCHGVGHMLVFSKGPGAVIVTKGAATVMMLGGESLGPRFIEWNFVSSSQDRIRQAKADWSAGRMQLPAGDDQEFIPLPPPT